MFVSEKTHKYNNFLFETSELISKTEKYAMLWYSARRIICVYVMFHSFNTLFSWKNTSELWFKAKSDLLWSQS